MTNEKASEALWQKYCMGVKGVTLFSWNRSMDVARMAIECGEPVETILKMLECDPKYRQRHAKHGFEYANSVRNSVYRTANQMYNLSLWYGRPMLCSRPLRFGASSWFNVIVNQLILALCVIAVLALCVGWVLQATHSSLCLKPTQPVVGAVCNIGEDWIRETSPKLAAR